MRVSHSKNFLYLANPRSGSRTIRRLIDTIITCDIIGGSPEYINGFNPTNPFWHHSTAKTLQLEFAKRNFNWEIYFKFTNIRNPWARVATLF